MKEKPVEATALPEELLDSARAEFLLHGFAAANVGRIATAAGISKKTIYKHVSSKEALLFAVMRSVISEPGSTMASFDAATPPAMHLVTFLTAFARLAFSADGITSYRLMMSEGTRFPELARSYVDAVDTFGVKPLADQLANYVAAGILAIGDPEATAHMLVSMVVAVELRNAALGLSPPPDAVVIESLVANAVRIFLDGVGLDRRRSASAPDRRKAAGETSPR